MSDNTELIIELRRIIAEQAAAIRAALDEMNFSKYGDPEVPFRMRDILTRAEGKRLHSSPRKRSPTSKQVGRSSAWGKSTQPAS